ncbi:hypothetical protein CVT26_005988 [Gymnopilus dilepis]|uniref:Uncharacterized protein n=1 Tax=Gymnopilus dilepis TaxID=231916 RepID=A0A409WFF2_9AGAR|nr:hypothetical protein CVT26_005988 [Gymnopilus dilepis]
MSLARLSLPSFSTVLEADPSIPRKKSAPALKTNQSDVSLGSSDSSSPIQTSQASFMKTIDFRDNDLESEEVELFSLIVGFPAEAGHAQAEAEAALHQGAPEATQLQHGQTGQALTLWIKANYPRLADVVRRLFPVKMAESLLRKVGQKISGQ